MTTLRSFIFLDQLQPQTLCSLGSWIRGALPRRNMAAQIIEVAPGIEVVSMITAHSVKAMELKKGSAVKAMVKASNVMLVTD